MQKNNNGVSLPKVTSMVLVKEPSMIKSDIERERNNKNYECIFVCMDINVCICVPIRMNVYQRTYA